MLKFSPANTKTKKLLAIPALQKYLSNKRKVYSLDLLSGWSCPGAKDCLAKVHVIDGRKKLKDGPDTQFRCYAASLEVVYNGVYNLHSHNFDEIRKASKTSKIVDLIRQSIPKNAGIVRYHTAGDFFSKNYAEAAVIVAEEMPDVLFYTYSKMSHLFNVPENPKLGIVRLNFLLTASLGGKWDSLIGDWRTAKVIFNESEAQGLPIDNNDSHAATTGGSFCLMIHGVQPAKKV